MKILIKFIKNNILVFLVGVSLCLNGVIIAENIISSEQVTYNGTTVKAKMDELVEAADFSDKIGSADISSIGNGTITDAINVLNTSLSGKAASSHTHDDRYYTESEVNTKLNSVKTIKSISVTGTTSQNGNVDFFNASLGTPIHAICTNRIDAVIVPYTKEGNIWWFHVFKETTGNLVNTYLTATVYYI